jgi:hypothetical protein
MIAAAHKKAFALLISLIGSLLFLRAYHLVKFAGGYEIEQANRSAVLFRSGAVLCGIICWGCGMSLLLEVIRKR